MELLQKEEAVNKELEDINNMQKLDEKYDDEGKGLELVK